MAKTKTVTSVITGDLINSREIKSSREWLVPLKKTLSLEGESPKTWEIFRGDSFQLEVKNPAKALLAAIRIKSTIKSIRDLDVRMAIGIGAKDFSAAKITESNGQAFIHSGEKLEALKREKQNLAIKTTWDDFDKEMNLMLRLALIAMDNWTIGAAGLITVLIKNPENTQNKIAKKLSITQSTLSERIKRSYYYEIMQLESFYQEKIKKLIS